MAPRLQFATAMLDKRCVLLMASAAGACVVPSASTTYPQPAPAPAVAASGASHVAGVPGRYSSPHGDIELFADGNALMGGQPGRWSADAAGTLTLHDGVQSVIATHRGDQLSIDTPGGPVVFTRGAAASPPPAQPPPTAGSVDGRLVGCWEDVSVTGTGNGSSSYQRTVRLSADGRYAIHAFTSVSAGEFSTADEDHEDGTWSADASALLLSPRQSAPYRASYRLDGGILYLGRDRFIPCS